MEIRDWRVAVEGKPRQKVKATASYLKEQVECGKAPL
jgi:hypothetical protein